MRTGCTCPTPFTEDNYLCRACELLEQEIWARHHPLPLTEDEVEAHPTWAGSSD